MTGPLLAGVELGGTKCVCILGRPDGDFERLEEVPTTTADATLTAIEDVLDRWGIASRAAALGIASFGPLSLVPGAADYGSIFRTPKPGWSGANVLTRLQTRYRLRTAIDTDVTGAALAEGLWGAAKGLRSWIYVTVGTGVGAGIIVNGSPVLGCGHAEAGHMRVARAAGDIWEGTCPYHGDCVEGLASGRAIAARVNRSASQLDPDDPLWEPVAHALAGMVHNLLLSCVPERVLIGGGVAEGQPKLLDFVRAKLVQSLGGYGCGKTVEGAIDQFLIAPGLGSKAGPLGALAVALTRL